MLLVHHNVIEKTNHFCESSLFLEILIYVKCLLFMLQRFI